MKRWLILCIAAFSTINSLGQTSPLTVGKIMRDPKTWIGAWPGMPYWAEDGKTVYFNWNPKGKYRADSLYKTSPMVPTPQQLTTQERRSIRPSFSGWHHTYSLYNPDFSKKVFTHRGDLYLLDTKTQAITQLTQTISSESDPAFSMDGQYVYFQKEQNLFRLSLKTGSVSQMTDIRTGEAPPPPPKYNEQDKFLLQQQRNLFKVIRDKTERSEYSEAFNKREDKATQLFPSPFYLGKRNLRSLSYDGQNRFVVLNLITRSNQTKNTAVGTYVSEDGYAGSIRTRAKVGQPADSYEMWIMDTKRDTTYSVSFAHLPGADRVPQYLTEQGVKKLEGIHKRGFIPYGPLWNLAGTHAYIEIRTTDNKDRWLALLNPESGELKIIDHQYDEAWIAGPGISWAGGSGETGWLPDQQHVYFQSEKTGYSHLYVYNVNTQETKALTSGSFEIFDPYISKDGQYWYFTSSEETPFERHFYRMPVHGGKREKLTTLIGKNEVALSPDEKRMAILYSYSNKPPEIYLQEIGKAPVQITSSPTDEWLRYAWRDPEIIMIRASDGKQVPARLYKPKKSNGAGVLFVHGAGYLQNVHRWWSTYFREYMFHNLLADMGYTVLDVDYRASEGYGRDWRTAIYRHMGGRDLQDFVDASRYLTQNHRIQPDRIGIYGGSYGGFITLMALFTESKHFGAGAALRSVTDWAHYNHPYTANILNTPAQDSLSYARSSPINFASGLEDPLLICHGVVDTNVHFQDVVRLSQKLIELEKDNWEMALYPVEDHGFVEPSSWTDEYRRILKLFEDHIGPNRLPRSRFPK
ncbi:MAG TPA: prolyl oligopeptidase family serine peptidase [Rhodothermales bacterium]|nr:prolyl oligopeptidase family serine peptidase [Rhodothermales bacterium]HRR09522.1 prolyl oligopeptidase family serine peptidase [Rhodothermales bacterium]